MPLPAVYDMGNKHSIAMFVAIAEVIGMFKADLRPPGTYLEARLKEDAPAFINHEWTDTDIKNRILIYLLDEKGLSRGKRDLLVEGVSSPIIGCRNALLVSKKELADPAAKFDSEGDAVG
jgi:hypothetical protein